MRWCRQRCSKQIFYNYTFSATVLYTTGRFWEQNLETRLETQHPSHFFVIQHGAVQCRLDPTRSFPHSHDISHLSLGSSTQLVYRPSPSFFAGFAAFVPLFFLLLTLPLTASPDSTPGLSIDAAARFASLLACTEWWESRLSK